VDPLSLADRSWPLLKAVFGGHTAAYRLTRGVIGHHVPGLPPFLLLTHVGARSGTERTTPLVYVDDGHDLVIVASKGGNPRHPAWLHNLRAQPEVTIQVGSEHRRVRAREADAAERKRLWPRAVAVWGGYEDYQRRTDREIPLVILEPRP
jgi:deazaflavin-dependent oxidoreductase (nitroreductase family)